MKTNKESKEKWFIVTAYRAHTAKPKKRESITIYIKGENISDILEKYRKIPGIKKDLIPDIREATFEDTKNLGIKEKMRKEWYKSTKK